MILKYVGVSVAAKMSAKFRESTREIPKHRSKFTKNAIFDLSALFSSYMGFLANLPCKLVADELKSNFF